MISGGSDRGQLSPIMVAHGLLEELRTAKDSVVNG